MLHLNILPEYQKKEIKIKYFYDQSKKFFEITFFTLIIFTIIFLILKIILANHFITTIENTTILTKKTADFSRQISEINKKVNEVGVIQDEFVYWSKLIEQIRQKQTESLKLNQISINKKNKQLTLVGKAKTRDELLNFKKQIEDFGYFEEIILPIENLLRKNDVNFSLAITIKYYDFQ